MGALKTLFIILIILVIALFGLIIFSSILDGGFFDYYPPATNNEGGQSTEDNAYFSFSYPSSYDIEKTTYKSYPSIDLFPPLDKFAFRVWYEPSDGMNTQEYSNLITSNYENSEYTLVSQKTIVIDGINGHELLFSAEDSVGKFFAVDGFVVTGEKTINYQATIDAPDYSSAKADIDSIISTIKIK